MVSLAGLKYGLARVPELPMRQQSRGYHVYACLWCTSAKIAYLREQLAGAVRCRKAKIDTLGDLIKH